MTLSNLPAEALAVALLVLLPLLGGGFALVVPAADRLTLRAVGVVFSVSALAPAVWLCANGGGTLSSPGVPFALHFQGLAVPGALTILGVTPMALRAGAPRVSRGVSSYVAAVLVAEALAVVAVLVDDFAVAVAAATVAAVPFFALVALFGGGERGTVTWRATSLWLIVDGLALGAAIVAPQLLRASFVAPVDADTSVVVVCLLGPGLVRLAAGPWGLWALPVLEQSQVAPACLAGGLVAPVGVVLLGRGVAVADGAALATVMPVLAGVFAAACGIGAALVAAERDLRRMVAHLLGALGAVAAIVCLGHQPLAAAGLVGLTAFSAALCLTLVEAVERRLETRKTTELQGLMTVAPSLGVLLPASFFALCGLPGPGVAAALWPALAGLVVSADTGVVGVAAAVCGVSLLVAAAGVCGLVVRVLGAPRR